MRAETINNFQPLRNNGIKSKVHSLPINSVPSSMPSYAQKLSVNEIPANNIAANYMSVSFRGNAPSIKRAYVITSEDEDMPLMATKLNDSYIIDFDSQTEIIYGNEAKKYLSKHDFFEYDTQVIFPKKASGVLHIDGKDIKLPENSAVILNEGTKAKIDSIDGYPMMIMSKKDYDWYERYGRDAKDESIRNKFLELIYYNSHLYNGEFTPNIMLPEKLRDEKFLQSLSINKWQSRNNLVYDLYAKRDSLNEEDRKSVELAKGTLDRLFSIGLISQKDDGYVRFNMLYDIAYLEKYLLEKGFSEEETELIKPIAKQARQVHMDARFSIRNPESKYSQNLVQKMKEKGLLYSPKKQTGTIYWKECFGNEDSLRSALTKNGFTPEEQADIIRSWRETNITGFDISGLKFINENAAVYNLNNKINNWTHEKTVWVTNSTAITSKDGKTPFVGVSLVQADDKRPISMSELRKEEKLHSHPNLAEKRQTEVYVISSGAAALNVVKNGKSQVKILKEGDLAVVDAGVAHCVNSIHGEYEQIVAQIPSAFQYGFGFKQIVEPPCDYDEKKLTQQAFEELRKVQGN